MSKRLYRWRKAISHAEAREMQNMRDLGSSLREIALAFDCTAQTAACHTKPPKPLPDFAKRNQRLDALVADRSSVEREFIARRHGFAGYASLKVVLSQFRRKQRQSAGAEA